MTDQAPPRDQHDQHVQEASEHECPNTAAVTGLAREVEAMRRAMLHTATTGQVKRLAKVVTELSETVAGASCSATPDPVPSWLTLPTRAADARAVLSDLAGWLGDVYLRYADAARTFPECWLWHPEIVEELVWLMYAWLTAYREDEASVRLAGDWHDRLRPGVVRRIADYSGTCSLELHLPGRATAAPEVPVTDAAEAIAAWWTQHRDQPGPEPTNDQMIAAAAAARRARSAPSPPTTDQMLTHAARTAEARRRANGATGHDGETTPGTLGGAR